MAFPEILSTLRMALGEKHDILAHRRLIETAAHCTSYMVLNTPEDLRSHFDEERVFSRLLVDGIAWLEYNHDTLEEQGFKDKQDLIARYRNLQEVWGEKASVTTEVNDQQKSIHVTISIPEIMRELE